ncbi:alpha/beta fold hydrolase [Mucilaginibacter sp. 3215]|uniref:alpha/beta fold hydrolase n=1 Tax=Mucilaginibacter sp. 3215 TaxID=3373912 RepID=UPI003D21C9FC
MGIAKINNIDICYDILGENNDINVILISGLGTQMIRWTVPFCEMLVKKGFRVIRFDNRDAGASTFFSNENTPDLKELPAILQTGKSIPVPYTLFDMVSDVVKLMDFLSISKAHFAGRSMGGIIAQLIASAHPERVLSLTCIMSTSLNPMLPPIQSDVMDMMVPPKPSYTIEKAAFIEKSLAFASRITGSKYCMNESEHVAIIEEEMVRSNNQSGGLWRQLLAIMGTGYNRERLEKIKAPTLVIHGDEDPIFSPECGKDIARTIEGGKFVLIEGMGHEIPPALYARIVTLVEHHARDNHSWNK